MHCYHTTNKVKVSTNQRTSVLQPLYRSTLPSVLWRCWLGGRKGIRPVKIERWGAGVVICLEQGADLHMAQLMPLPLTSLASVKSRLVLPFWYRLTQVVLDKGPLNGCVCVCVLNKVRRHKRLSAAEAQINHQEDNFHCTPYTPGSQKWGGQRSPHILQLHRPCLQKGLATAITTETPYSVSANSIEYRPKSCWQNLETDAERCLLSMSITYSLIGTWSTIQ